MIHADKDLLSRLDDPDDSFCIEPYPDLDEQIQPASIDLRLGSEFLVAHGVDPNGTGTTLSFEETTLTQGDGQRFTIAPQSFVLATTQESVSIPDDVAGLVTGRSSVGRLGVFVHISAGLCDPGFESQITLELYNASPAPADFQVGQRVCQLMLLSMRGPAESPYGSNTNDHYQGQEGPTESHL